MGNKDCNEVKTIVYNAFKNDRIWKKIDEAKYIFY